MRPLRITLEYLRERQPPAVLVLHFIILCLVLSQITVSNFMGFTESGEISSRPLAFYGTWTHIGTGLFLLPAGFIFIFIELRRNGIQFYFPYVYNNFSQLKGDLQQLRRLELPDPNAYGLAASVQGLGFGALALVVLSGFTWFLSWIFAAPWAAGAKELHEALTGLIEAYVIGHGGMGVLHLVYRARSREKR
jgi:cytochrome b561